ncbi:MAG: hypothetical protein JOZ99_15075 [Actinobacteria bacterium]|nr:hypothetical protein [Actinomycetota bacterium]
MTIRTVEVIEADNPYMAALAARDRIGDGVEISDVTPAGGRARTTLGANGRRATKKARKATKVAKKRQLSPETRAKLAENLAKARAARAAKRKAAGKTTKKATKRATKKASKRSSASR